MEAGRITGVPKILGMWSTVIRPVRLADALAALSAHGAHARIVAGGTDVLVELQRGVKPTATLIDISALTELKYVRCDGDRIRLGGLATHNDVLAAPFAREAMLPLAQACIEVGAPQIRARGTVAGNLVTASPANDTIAPLLALDAELVLLSARGERTVALRDFFTGFRTTLLREDELVREVSFRALDAAHRGIFLKLGLRRAQAISVIDIALVLAIETDGTVGDARIALGCLAPTVVHAPHAERYLRGRHLDAASCAEAGRIACDDAAPIDDIRGSARYRRATLAALVARALQRIADGREADGYPEKPVLLQTPSSNDGARPFGGTIETTINGRPRTLGARAAQDAAQRAARERRPHRRQGRLRGRRVRRVHRVARRRSRDVVSRAGDASARRVDHDDRRARRRRELHPLQQAFIDCGAVQCGFCIPGMIMAGAKLLDERREPGIDDHQTAISGNICRCTGYRKILDAMDDAARAVATDERVPETVIA